MSLIYDQKIVNHLQNCLKTGNVEIKSIDSYDTMLPGLQFKLGDITVSFIKKPDTAKIPGYSSSSYMGDSASKEYMTEWKRFPVYTHLMKDMFRLRLDDNDNVPYKTFTYIDADGTKKRALVRHLFEIENMDADTQECVEYYEAYTDLIHADQCYLIIKIVDDNDLGYYQKTDINIKAVSVVTQEYSPIISETSEDTQSITADPLF